MGLAHSVESKTKEVLATQRLLDLKQKKRERDITQSMQLAATRDRLLWIGGYYAFVGLLSISRHAWMHRRRIPITWDNFFTPLNQAFLCLPPFLFGYQLDYACFGKGERIAAEAARIREGTSHRWFDSPWLPMTDDAGRWFNQPLDLPRTLEPTYGALMEAADAERAAAGQPPAPRWARFWWVPP